MIKKNIMITKKEILDIIKKEQRINLHTERCVLLEKNYEKVVDNIIEKINLKRKAKKSMDTLNFEIWKKDNLVKIYGLYFSKCYDDVLTEKQVKILYNKYNSMVLSKDTNIIV